MTTTRSDQPTPMAAGSLIDAVHHAVRRRILAGAVTPGSLVTELAVATEFGVARVTAKAAVERLVQDGLLRRTAHKSARVPVVDANDVFDAYFSRRLLEGSAIQQLAEEGRVPEQTRIALKRFDAAAEHSEWGQVAESESAFHRSLVDALGIFRLSKIFGSYMDEIQLYQTQIDYQTEDLVAETRQEYGATIAAIEARNSAQAARIIDAHLYKRCTRIVEQVRDNTNPAPTATLIWPSQWRREET